MIIDGSYFDGVLSIGILWDVDSESVSRTAEEENLKTYIDLYEREYLRLVLGKNMSREFMAYLSSGKDDSEKWNKLKERLAVKGNSPVANYVYFNYVRRCGVKQTPVGTVYASGDDRANPNVLLVSSWNDMVEMNDEFLRFLSENEDYKGFEFSQCMLERINLMGV